MTPDSSTVVAQLTPRGRGAVATVLLRGPAAVECVDRRFRPHGRTCWPSAPLGCVLVGIWQSRPSRNRGDTTTDAAGEELVVCRTGEDRVEIHCHGGPAAVSAIVESLLLMGCHEVDWPAALVDSAESAIRQAARLALAASRTERVAAILLDQYEGALEHALQELSGTLERADVERAGQLVDRLWRYRTLGTHLTRSWRIVLAGPPNVGKSSLINAVMGFSRALVFDQPGTTRDVVTATTALDGWPVELADTAGLRTTQDPLESAGVRRARARLDASDLVVLVFDATCRASPHELPLQEDYPQAVVVFNKCDLTVTRQRISPQPLLTSAVTGAGLDELVRTLSKRLVPQVPRPGEAVPFEPHQFEVLQQVRVALQQSDLARARQHVVSLLAR